MFDTKLLDLLACPQCKGQLRFAPDLSGLICDACALRYPVNNGVAVLRSEEATPLATTSTGSFPS